MCKKCFFSHDFPLLHVQPFPSLCVIPLLTTRSLSSLTQWSGDWGLTAHVPPPCSSCRLSPFLWMNTDGVHYTCRARKRSSLKMGKQRGRDCMSQDQEGGQELLHLRLAKHMNSRKCSYSFQNPKPCLASLLSHIAEAEVALLSDDHGSQPPHVNTKAITGWLVAGTCFIFTKLQRWQNPRELQVKILKWQWTSPGFLALFLGVALSCLSVSSKMIKNL